MPTTPDNFPIGDKALSVEGVATKISSSTRHVQKLIELRAFPSFRLGRYIRVRESDVDAYIAKLIAEEAKRLEELAE